jgi:hypothetical protein
LGAEAGEADTFIAATAPVGGSAALRASMPPPRIMRPMREARNVVIIFGFTCNKKNDTRYKNRETVTKIGMHV